MVFLSLLVMSIINVRCFFLKPQVSANGGEILFAAGGTRSNEVKSLQFRWGQDTPWEALCKVMKKHVKFKDNLKGQTNFTEVR